VPVCHPRASICATSAGRGPSDEEIVRLMPRVWHGRTDRYKRAARGIAACQPVTPDKIEMKLHSRLIS